MLFKQASAINEASNAQATRTTQRARITTKRNHANPGIRLQRICGPAYRAGSVGAIAQRQEERVGSFEWADAIGNKVKKRYCDFQAWQGGRVTTVEGVSGRRAERAEGYWRDRHHRRLPSSSGQSCPEQLRQCCDQAKRAEDERVKTINDNGGSEVGQLRQGASWQASKPSNAQIFPDKAYAAQRTWLQLTLRKPLEMTIWSFMIRVETINNYLTFFSNSGWTECADAFGDGAQGAHLEGHTAQVAGPTPGQAREAPRDQSQRLYGRD